MYVSFAESMSAFCKKDPTVSRRVHHRTGRVKRCPGMCRFVFVALFVAAQSLPCMSPSPHTMIGVEGSWQVLDATGSAQATVLCVFCRFCQPGDVCWCMYHQMWHLTQNVHGTSLSQLLSGYCTTKKGNHVYMMGDEFCFVLFFLKLSVCKVNKTKHSVCLWWHDYCKGDFPTQQGRAPRA